MLREDLRAGQIWAEAERTAAGWAVVFREERGRGRGKSKFKAWFWNTFPRGGLETGAPASGEDLDKHVGSERTRTGRGESNSWGSQES